MLQPALVSQLLHPSTRLRVTGLGENWFDNLAAGRVLSSSKDAAPTMALLARINSCLQ